MKKITLLLMFLSTIWTYAQVSSYSFLQTTGTYTEITGGTLLGSEASDAQRFLDPAVPLGATTATGVGFPIGFNFTYNGYTYDRFGVLTDGWIALGSSVFTPSVNTNSSSLYVPLASTSVIAQQELVSRISALSKDMQGQVGSTIRIETIGTAPNRTLVVQWKNFRKYAATGDSFNFQIRLNETSNTIDIVYGAFTSNATTGANYQVGLRATPDITATNFTNRTSTTGWGVTTPGLLASNTVLMSDVLTPSNGLTFTWTPPLCGGTGSLVTTAITTSGATLAWTAALPTPVGYEYVVSSSTTFPVGSGTATANTTETISGLNPNTVYNVFIRSNCGTEYTAWILLGNFKTKCLDDVYINESFDLYATAGNIMPDCWVKAGNGSAYIAAGSAAPGSVPNRLYMLGNGTTPTVAYAILPSLSNLSGGTHRLKFEAYATSANRFLDIGYLTDASDVSTFVLIETFALPSTAAPSALEFISTPTGIPAGVKNLAFRNAGVSDGSTSLYIDDVVWEPIPTCPDVTALVVNGMTSTTANVAWTVGGTETAWQYVVGVSTITNPNTITSIVDVTSSAIVVPGLTPSTSYKIWVRSSCGATSLGAWIGPKIFATPCSTVTEFSQNFDYGTTPPLPPCWTKIGTLGNGYSASYTNAASAPNSLYTYSSATSQSVTALPPVSNSGTGTHRLRFKYRSTTINAVLQVGYLLDIADPTSFVPLLDFIATNTTAWLNDSAVLGADPTTPNLAFRNLGTPTATIYIDDVVWEPIPTCLDVTGLSATGVNSTSTDISWTAGGAETSWQYAIGASTLVDPSTLTPVIVTATTINIGSLTPSTSYKIWVRSYCSATDLGAWMGPITVSTTCAPVTTFIQNFDSGTTFAACWSKVGTTGSAYPSSTAGAPSTPNTLYMNGSTATPAVVAMQPASNTSLGTHRLKFKFRGSSATNAVLEVGYLTNPNDATTFNSLQSFTATSTTVYDIHSVELGTEPLSQVLAFRKGGTSNTVYIDDVIWEAIPTCLDVTAMTVSGVTSSNATVNWTAGGTETSWQYVYGPATLTDPSTLTPALVTATTAALTGLTPNTAYKVWVRSYCSATDLGAWIGPVFFATTCAPVTEFTQNFDSGTTFAACWSKVGTTGSAYPTSATGTPSAPNALYMSGSTATPAVVAMQSASNTAAGTHRLKFKFRGSAVGAVLEVGYLDNPTDANSFVPLQNYAANSTTVYDVISAELGTDPLSQVLAFRKGGTSNAVYIDDVAWELIPSTIPVCATGITAVPNLTCGNFATAITWSAAAGADGYKLTIGTTAGGTEIFNNQDIGGGLSYQFIGNFNTTYYYKITPYNSFGDAIGCTEQSFVTAVNGCVCTSVPTSNDGAGITNILLDTTNFPNGDVMYANYTTTPVNLPQALTANLQLSFNTSVFDYHTNVWVDFNDNLTFESAELVFIGVSSTTSPNVLNASFLVPATAPLGAHRMRIVATDNQQTPPNPCYSGTYGVTLDFSIVVTAPPACLPVTGLTVNSSTSSTASISWLAPSPAPAIGYDYYYATTNTAPTATTTPSGSVGAGITTASLSALTPATVYYVWVRSVCSVTDLSPWAPSITFTTACVSATAPYSQNFETATVPGMPLCSTIENAGTGNNWTTAASPGFGFTSKVLRYQYNGSNAANAWYYTQPVTLTAGTSYDISYKYGNSSVSFWSEKLKVAYGTSASAAAMTTVLADHPNVVGAVATTNTVTFIPTVSGDYYFGFNAYSIANQDYLYVDDIMVQATLATNAFDNNGFTYYPNPVKDVLNLGYNQEITNVAVYNLLGQQVITKAVKANQSQIDMSNLTRGTYMVKITADNQVKTIKVIKE